MEGESALTVSLEELGLSRYEARAYVALITKGTMSAGDLAFYSEIPRAKIYSTMKKLASKNLAITSNTKSAMVCTAVRPEDAFDGIIHEQIQKVTAMNALVADLKNISEMNRRAGDSEEKRYMQIGTGSVLPKLQEMTISAEASITITADDGGLGLLSGCRDQLLAAQKKDVRIRCVIPHGEVCSEQHRALPRGVEARASHGVSGSCIVFDGTDVMILDGADGRGAVFESAPTLGSAHTAIFEKMWSESMPVDVLADMAPEDARQICRIISTTGTGGLQYLLGEMAGADPRNDDGDDGRQRQQQRPYCKTIRAARTGWNSARLQKAARRGARHVRCHNADHVLGERLHGCEGPKRHDRVPPEQQQFASLGLHARGIPARARICHQDGQAEQYAPQARRHGRKVPHTYRQKLKTDRHATS